MSQMIDGLLYGSCFKLIMLLRNDTFLPISVFDRCEILDLIIIICISKPHITHCHNIPYISALELNILCYVPWSPIFHYKITKTPRISIFVD